MPRNHWNCCSHRVPDPGHQYTHCHTTGPLARPMLDYMRSRLLSLSAAGEIEERQTGSSTAQSGQHAQATQAKTSNSFPSRRTVSVCPITGTSFPREQACPPPCRPLWPKPPLACQFLPTLSGGHGPPETGSERFHCLALGPKELRLKPVLAW